VIDPAQDAFGVALLDYCEGRHVPELMLEVKGGSSGPAMHPEWFFRSFECWDWWERELLPLVCTSSSEGCCQSPPLTPRPVPWRSAAGEA
jgi:hypothetical protein